MKIEKKNLDTPDERRPFENGKLDIVTVGSSTLERFTFEPGWKWFHFLADKASTKGVSNARL
jgi:hypothetical protein